jgi:hypothetical protein
MKGKSAIEYLSGQKMGLGLGLGLGGGGGARPWKVEGFGPGIVY